MHHPHVSRGHDKDSKLQPHGNDTDPHPHPSAQGEAQKDGKAFLGDLSVNVDSMCRKCHHSFLPLEMYELRMSPCRDSSY